MEQTEKNPLFFSFMFYEKKSLCFIEKHIVFYGGKLYHNRVNVNYP